MPPLDDAPWNDATALFRFQCASAHVLRPTEASRARLRALATRGAAPIVGPVTIVAGGCDAAVQDEMERYRPYLERGFADWHGTLVSGGTRSGISGIAGAIGALHADRIHTLGYLPGCLEHDRADTRYAELRRVGKRAGFSALEPLQAWIDMLVTGLRPRDVRLLGIGGGPIAALEYRVAWAFGARVAIVGESGRAADEIECAVRRGEFVGVRVLPRDTPTLRAFLEGGGNAHRASHTPHPG